MNRVYINDDDLHDIGIVTHYKGEPFSGILYDTYENGIISDEFSLFNGLKNGVSKNYYDSGKIKLETTFKKDVENGIQKVYHEEGFVVEISEYQDGYRIKKESITSIIRNPLTLLLLTNLFIVFDYFTLKKENIKLQLEFVEEDFYSDFDSFYSDMKELDGSSNDKLFSGLRSSIIPFELSEEGDFEELVENPIEIPGVFGFSNNSSSESIYLIGNIPMVEPSGMWDYRTTLEFDNIDKLISYMDENYSIIQYDQLSPEEKKRVTYIKEKRE